MKTVPFSPPTVLAFTVSMILAFSNRSALAAESAEFADKVVREHCSANECRNPQQLRNILTTAPGLTRNIGTEDPTALQGPNNSFHPASRAACVAKVLNTGSIRRNPAFERKCGAKWMAPVPTAGTSQANARVCIDQFEFPNMPCEYPVAWTSFRQAHDICRSMGKRLCNSSEWEGGCAGSIETRAPYQSQRAQHNAAREVVWAFQWIPQLSASRESRGLCGVYTANDPEIDPSVRGRYSPIGASLGCHPSPSRALCGTNTWPSGFKNTCVSQLGVYEMHGNLAEVTNLPTGPNTIADMSGTTGVNEHKGSFFVYRSSYPDDCRIRQPGEHQFTMANDRGHSFYQEGFRCCKDVE